MTATVVNCNVFQYVVSQAISQKSQLTGCRKLISLKWVMLKNVHNADIAVMTAITLITRFCMCVFNINAVRLSVKLGPTL